MELHLLTYRLSLAAPLPLLSYPILHHHHIGYIRLTYANQVFNSVEIKPEMTGHYLAEFSCSYRPVKHGRPGVGASSSNSISSRN